MKKYSRLRARVAPIIKKYSNRTHELSSKPKWEVHVKNSFSAKFSHMAFNQNTEINPIGRVKPLPHTKFWYYPA